MSSRMRDGRHISRRKLVQAILLAAATVNICAAQTRKQDATNRKGDRVTLIKDFGLKEYTYLSKDLPHSEKTDWKLICQLPHNAQFQPWIELESDKDQVITLNSTNPLATWMQPLQSYTTVLGVQTHEAPGWVSGEGAVYTIPAGVTVRSVKYRETGYDTEFAGSFKCNDDDYNILWKKATRTCYLCMRKHFMDCPDRERTPKCLGDVCIQMEQIFYTFDTKSHELARQAILKDPNYTHIIDQNLMFAGEYGTWFYYLNTGDLATIKTQYPNLKKYLAKWKLGKNGVIEHNTKGWDWCDWGSPSKDKQVTQCCQYYSTLKACRKMAQATGNTDDIPAYDKILSSIEKSFDTAFWKGSYYMSDDVKYPDERANAMAVITGLAAPSKWDAIYKNVLSKKLNPNWEDGNTYNASSYFERWVMEALCKMGKEEFALLRMHDRYKDQIDCRTTSLWEHYGRWWQTHFDPNSTQNHGWNSPNTILSRYIAGIAPETPGWETFHVLPQEAFLKSIDVNVATVKGNVHVCIKKTESTYTLKLTSPPGANAIVGIPRKSFKALRFVEINSKTVWGGAYEGGVSGVSWKEDKNGYVKFAVTPGAWEIVGYGSLDLSSPKSPRAPEPKDAKLDKKNWIATASSTHRGPTLSYKWGKKQGGSPADAIDGDAWTSWSTGVKQAPGQWFQIDMGKAQTFDKIILENGWAPYDYARALAVYVSDNGKDWGEPIAKVKCVQSLNTITFKSQTKRYIKLEQTSSHEHYWWSIFEMDVYDSSAI